MDTLNASRTGGNVVEHLSAIDEMRRERIKFLCVWVALGVGLLALFILLPLCFAVKLNTLGKLVKVDHLIIKTIVILVGVSVFGFLTDLSTRQTYERINKAEKALYEYGKKQLLRIYPH